MILLKNGTYIDWQTLEIRQTDIFIETGVNGCLHFSNPLTHSADSEAGREYPESAIK